jgi:hypothetical protein
MPFENDNLTNQLKDLLLNVSVSGRAWSSSGVLGFTYGRCTV